LFKNRRENILMYPENLKYNKEHLWARIEGDIAYIGITDFAQQQLGDILFVEMPEVGDKVTMGESFGVIESAKTASDLICPLSGEVIEINEELDDEPEKVNGSPYEAWIIKINIKDANEIDELLNSAEYQGSLEK